MKTFSLLPGEQTTITVDSYPEGRHDVLGRVVDPGLDGLGVRCGLRGNRRLGERHEGDVGRSGGCVDIGERRRRGGWRTRPYGNSLNAGERVAKNTTKAVQNAQTKRSSKASSNRAVSVNTEFARAVQQGRSQDTTRTLKNINVSRVLNVVFRQMTQEHVVILHLTQRDPRLCPGRPAGRIRRDSA